MNEAGEKAAMQLGLAAVNGIGSTLIFKHSEGKKPLYGFGAGLLLIFAGYHIWKAVALYRGEEIPPV